MALKKKLGVSSSGVAKKTQAEKGAKANSQKGTQARYLPHYYDKYAIKTQTSKPLIITNELPAKRSILARLSRKISVQVFNPPTNGISITLTRANDSDNALIERKSIERDHKYQLQVIPKKWKELTEVALNNLAKSNHTIDGPAADEFRLIFLDTEFNKAMEQPVFRVDLLPLGQMRSVDKDGTISYSGALCYNMELKDKATNEVLLQVDVHTVSNYSKKTTKDIILHLDSNMKLQERLKTELIPLGEGYYNFEGASSPETECIPLVIEAFPSYEPASSSSAEESSELHAHFHSYQTEWQPIGAIGSEMNEVTLSGHYSDSVDPSPKYFDNHCPVAQSCFSAFQDLCQSTDFLPSLTSSADFFTV